MSSGGDNVIELDKTQDAIVYERVVQAIYESGQGMPASRVVGVLEAVKFNLFKMAKDEGYDW